MALKADIDHGSIESLREEKRMERIRKYIGDNLSADLSASTLSREFELSASSLLNIFKKNENQTCRQYVEEIRLNKAFDLIFQKGYRVQQAMYATGYSYKSTFNKAFKKKFKHAPSHFQKIKE